MSIMLFYFSLKFLILDVDLHQKYKTLNKHIYISIIWKVDKKYIWKRWNKVNCLDSSN